jgi:hypothetical protein
MTNLYIITTSDLPNHVILGHASFAKEAGFNPIFIFPDRGNGDKYAEYYKEYSVLFTRTLFSNTNFPKYLFSILSYAIGVSKLLLFNKEIIHILAVDFEGTLASIILKFRGAKVYSLVNDNFAIRYKLDLISFTIIRFFESLTYKVFSNVSIFPDNSRVQLLGGIKPNKIVILPNTLNDNIHTRYQGNANEHLIVLICGWLDKTRGLELLKLLSDKTNEKVQFLLVGRGDMAIIDDLTCYSERIRFIGHMSREKTIELMSTVDINFAFYNPSIIINRYALPQKVSDSLSVGCPIIINSEVQMADLLFTSGSAFSAEYWDILGISSILNILLYNKEKLKITSENCIAFNKNCISFETVHNTGVAFYKNMLQNNRINSEII